VVDLELTHNYNFLILPFLKEGILSKLSLRRRDCTVSWHKVASI